MSIDFQASIVYLLNAGPIYSIDNRTAGTGFVVTADGLIVTCAHVIDFAQLSELVHLIFYDPNLPKEKREIRVARVVPDYLRDMNVEDIAILRLEGALPRQVVPLPLRQSFNTQGQTFRSFGFPEAKPEDGLLSECRILGSVSADNIPLLQLSSGEISKGFSGAPIWDDKHQAVIGVVTSIIGTRRVKIAGTDIELPYDRSWRHLDTAFATPAETLRKVCPLLQISDVCPYCGLDAFTEVHAQFFFGREYLIGRLLNRLRQDVRFLAVLGPSGSGKSSLVQAGLLPQLRQGAIGDSDYWGVIVTRPADDPFKQLATKGFMVESQGFAESVRAWLTEHPKQTRLVLVIDQFEELLTTCPEMIRQNFIRQLTSLLESPVPITVILVMRDDFYNQLVQQEALVEWLERSLGPINIPQTLKWDEVIAIVQKPAEAVGLRFEEGLVETIVNDAMETATIPVDEGRVARSTILPLLEFALTELWGKREEGILSRRAYNAIDGVTGGLTQWADRVFYGLKTKEEQWEEKQRMEQQRLARRIFTDLVHIGNESQGLPNSRRRMSLISLCRKESEIADVRQVVQQLVDGHLLVTSYDIQRKEEMVEIIHDALLWEWGQLRQWLQNDHDFLVWHQEFEKRVRAWLETNVDDPIRREENKLFGGSDLTEAIGWSVKCAADLSQVEHDFIQVSISRQKQEEWLRKRYDQDRLNALVRRRLVVGGLVGLGLAAVGTGGAIWRWRSLLPNYNTLMTYRGHSAAVWGIVWSPDAQYIASASADRTVQLWQANTGRHIYTYTGHKDGVVAVSFSPDGYYIASASYDQTVQVWNQDNLNPDGIRSPFTYHHHTNYVLAVAWSPDGARIASGSLDRTVQVWRTKDGAHISSYYGHTDSVNALAWSSNSKRIASGSGDKTVQVWDVDTGHLFRKYLGHSSHVLALAWSPDGTRIASAGLDNTVQIWSVAKDDHIYTYHGHLDAVVAVAWSLDGSLIASASADKTVQVWKIADGSLVCKYQGHTDKLETMAWSPQDPRIASAGYDKTVQVWHIV